MTTKAAIRLILLLFVAASVAFVAAKNTGLTGDKKPAGAAQSSSCQGLDGGISCNVLKGAEAPERKIIAYYFHGNVRCMTCRAIEDYAREAIEGAFSEDIEQGRVEFRSINLEEGGNQHFVDDFKLTTRAVVLSEVNAGKQVRWKNLDKVWQLVRQKRSFTAYIEDEMRQFLGALG